MPILQELQHWQMLGQHRDGDTKVTTVLVTEATRQQSVNYGCIVEVKTIVTPSSTSWRNPQLPIHHHQLRLHLLSQSVSNAPECVQFQVVRQS